MKTAEKRKKEQLRVEERKIDRERQKEGDMFGDKEQFVTSAYKKRQEERRLEEEEERREAALEGLLIYINLLKVVMDRCGVKTNF